MSTRLPEDAHGADHPTPGADPAQRRRALLAGSIGNVIEWYDFGVYAYFATVIAATFFPDGHSVAALLSSFAVFAVAYFFRPLGAFVFGHIGDRFGRRISLAIAIVLMAAGTTVIGLIPGYVSIGIWAPVLLVIARITQGFSVGGEFGGSATMVVEYARDGRRATLGALLQTSTALGLLLGSAMGALLTSTLNDQALGSWGWRIPFLLGLPLGAVGYYLRYRLHEPPQFQQNQEKQRVARTPLREILSSHLRPLARGMALVVAWLFGGGIVLSYMPTYLASVNHLDKSTSQLITFIGMIAYVLFIPVTGVLSDRYGRRPILLIAVLGLALSAYPAFLLIHQDSLAVIIIGYLILLWFMALYGGPVPAILSEQFPTRVRVSGVGISYALTVAVFQGTAPLLATSLIGATGYTYIPAACMLIIGVPSLIAVIRMRETRNDPLT